MDRVSSEKLREATCGESTVTSSTKNKVLLKQMRDCEYLDHTYVLKIPRKYVI